MVCPLLHVPYYTCYYTRTLLVPQAQQPVLCRKPGFQFRVTGNRHACDQRFLEQLNLLRRVLLMLVRADQVDPVLAFEQSLHHAADGNGDW